MREVPICMTRRYQALDDLVAELSAMSNETADCPNRCNEEPGIKLMCDFWNILKEDPDCNLTQVVKQRMGLTTTSASGFLHPQNVTCYMAGAHNCSGKPNKKKNGSSEAVQKIKSMCCRGEPETDASKSKCCTSKSVTPNSTTDAMPLSKVLCNLQEAASFEKKCNARINDLMETQRELTEQIMTLEQREKEGVKLLKQADCLWSCMEDQYKKKIAESAEKQKGLLKELKEVETSASKWRKNKKDLESQIDTVIKCQQEITEKIQHKTNDIKCMDAEIGDFKKRNENNLKDIEAAKKSLGTKKQASDAKIAGIAAEITRLEKQLSEQKKFKTNKEHEGAKYVKEAREDLQQICRVLLQKRLENEDLHAEKEALLGEIDLLKQTCDQCKDKCVDKQKAIIDEIKKIDLEIAEFKVKCIRCHECTDTIDIRKFCTDCPKCLQDRECIMQDGHCVIDESYDCVCMSIKQKFLDNVFDNMYTILERQTKTGPGKAVADAVLNCLKRSRNGKLNEETRKILQDFILTTVKKNLNLTIVGGAVKTRCEMDADTYKQLLLCLNQVKATKPPKEDKGTLAKKDACRRWGGTNECNCPKGPKNCLCVKKAPPPPQDPSPCPPPPKDMEDAGEVIACPHKESTSCGPDCAMHAVPSLVGTDIASWRPDPCKAQSCPFSKNMRAAQCVLGPESLSATLGTKGYLSPVPYVPDIQEGSSKDGSKHTDLCKSKKGEKLKAEIAIECNKNSCTLFRKSPEHASKSLELNNIKRKGSDLNNKDKVSRKTEENKSILSEKTEINQELVRKTIGSYDLSHVKQIIPDRDLLKVIVQSNMILNDDSTTDLIKTSSGNFAIALQESIVREIESISMKGEHTIALKKTSSGNLLLDLNPKEDDPDKVIINRCISSNNIFLEVPKGVMNIIEPEMSFNESQTEDYLSKFKKIIVHTETQTEKLKITVDKSLPRPSIDDIQPKVAFGTSISKERITKFNDDNNECNCREKTISKKSRQNIRDEIIECSLIPIEYYKKQLEKVYYNNQPFTMKVQGENGLSTDVDTKVTRTLSGNIAINIKNLSDLGIILSLSKECPVLLTKSCFGTYILHISNKSKAPNAVLRRTSSGEILVVITEPILKSMDSRNHNFIIREEYYKVRIRGLSKNKDSIEPPALLKSTPSENYVIVLDKEFEKRHRQTIQESIGDNNVCYVELHKTDSEYCLINFDNTENDGPNHQNALLVKTSSGTLKVLVNSNVFETIDSKKSISNKSFIGSRKSIKEFDDLLSTLPPSSREFHRKNLKKSKLDTKSSSDSELFEKVKLKLQDSQCLLTEPSGILKKTMSGQYAVVINKESKKTFINNLKNYVSNTSHDLIPVKKTESGEITISLSSETEGIGQGGALKITPSGNIYIIVDEKLIKRLPNNGSTSKVKYNKSNESSSKCIINLNKNPANKGVATSCNADPSDETCDSSKCVCRELQGKCDDCTYEEDKTLTLFQTESSYVNGKRKEPRKSIDSHDRGSKLEYCCKDGKEKSPHIVIKPCGCRPILKRKPKSCEECYYVVQSVCPFHKDRYKSLSNELLEISGLCNKAQKKKKVNALGNKNEEQGSSDSAKNITSWNSLDYLPPQLPEFLKGVNYK